MKAAILSPLVAGALREAMIERLAIHAKQEAPGICDWCWEAFDAAKPRYHVNELTYCSAGCRDLDQEDA